MARLATLIADHLSEIAEITTLVGGEDNPRVFDLDYRVAGWNTAPVSVLDPRGLMLPTLVVDDMGSTRPVFSNMTMAEEDTIGVWVFVSRTRPGILTADTLMRLVKDTLNGWQEPTTRRTVHWTMRLGQVPAEDGVYDRQDFRLAGIPE